MSRKNGLGQGKLSLETQGLRSLALKKSYFCNQSKLIFLWAISWHSQGSCCPIIVIVASVCNLEQSNLTVIQKESFISGQPLLSTNKILLIQQVSQSSRLEIVNTFFCSFLRPTGLICILAKVISYKSSGELSLLLQIHNTEGIKC